MPGKSRKPKSSGGKTTRSSSSAKSAAANRKSKSRGTATKRRNGDGAAFDGAESVDAERDAAARAALLESDKLYYRIGEVSRLTGVKAHVLRYWETEFRWMAPPKSRSKQRLYRKRDIEFVWLLKKLLWEERYTIAGARQRIQELGVDDALALLDGSTGAAATDAAASPATDEAAGPALSTAQWTSFRAALEDMQDELVALRGALQDGA